MLAYQTPGVYFDWPESRPTVRALRTDVAGFVGIAERGPLHRPVKVESASAFASTFGRHRPQGYLAYGVAGFFDNGGRTCWVVRVADPEKAAPAAFDLLDEDGGTALRLVASSPGVWGGRLQLRVVPTGADRFTLIVGIDGQREVWRDLTARPGEPRFAGGLINGDSAVGFGGRGSPGAAPGSRLVRVVGPDGAPAGPPDGRLRRMPGRDGLRTLQLRHLVGARELPLGESFGLALLEGIDEISFITAPDFSPVPRVAVRFKARPSRCERLGVPAPEPSGDGGTPPELPPLLDTDSVLELQRALVDHCERLKDRVALLDVPLGSDPQEALDWRRRFDSSYAAFYHPWLRVPDPLGLQGLLRTVPPSGHAAGVLARSDLRSGVAKPPANEVVEGAADLADRLEDVEHGRLNDLGVNVLRPFPSRGIRIAGARTAASDAALRYLNVRRLLIAIAEALDEQMQWVVFEPNDRTLWQDVDRVVRAYLDGLWRGGQLDGATADEAYSVLCDETTNPPEEREAGRVTCLVGVRPPWPAEFVVVRIARTESGIEVLGNEGGRHG